MPTGFAADQSKADNVRPDNTGSPCQYSPYCFRETIGRVEQVEEPVRVAVGETNTQLAVGDRHAETLSTRAKSSLTTESVSLL